MSDITMEKIAGLHKAIANRLVPHALGCICAACTLADLARTLLTRARIAERERDEARAFLAESDKDHEHIRAENEALRDELKRTKDLLLTVEMPDAR